MTNFVLTFGKNGINDCYIYYCSAFSGGDREEKETEGAETSKIVTWYTLPSKNNYTHTKFDIHFQDALNLK